MGYQTYQRVAEDWTVVRHANWLGRLLSFPVVSSGLQEQDILPLFHLLLA